MSITDPTNGGEYKGAEAAFRNIVYSELPPIIRSNPRRVPIPELRRQIAKAYARVDLRIANQEVRDLCNTLGLPLPDTLTPDTDPAARLYIAVTGSELALQESQPPPTELGSTEEPFTAQDQVQR